MKINVCGCSLADNLYTGIDFTSPSVAKYLSKRNGDGGISPGRLVFAEALERFSGVPFERILSEVTSGAKPAARNLGGPAIVGAVCASQVLYKHDVEFNYYGAAGDDATGDFIRSMVSKTPVGMAHYATVHGASPYTDVLSDPSANDGKGERSFINCVGSSSLVTEEFLGDGFFDADVTWFAATALVPAIHDSLTRLVKKAKSLGRYTIVSTLYDFRNEKRDPVGRWPLGESLETYANTDLLIVDFEEALRLSGADTLEKSFEFFISHGVSSFFVTHGAHAFYAWSDGRIFEKTPCAVKFPVSAAVDSELAAHPERRGDTTGCGDNFAGGVVSSFVRQLLENGPDSGFSIRDAAAWGAACGGAACFQTGGTYIEKTPGGKRRSLLKYVDDYLK